MFSDYFFVIESYITKYIVCKNLMTLLNSWMFYSLLLIIHFLRVIYSSVHLAFL